VRCDGGRFTTPPPSRLEARSRLNQHSCSFDHLVGADQKRRCDRQLQSLRRSQIEHKLQMRRLLDRKVGGCRSTQDFGG
jgi:hypothetical protein